MKLPVSKSSAIAGAGILLIGGFILAAELKSQRPEAGREASSKEHGPKKARGSTSPDRPTKAEGCPGEVTVEDPTVKAPPDFIKTRFATKTCSRTAAGQLNGCLDQNEEACKKRLEGISKLVKNPGECLARPAEVFCSVHVLADGNVSTACFETKQACDTHHERKRGRPKICRTAPTCEQITLPPL